MSFPRERPHYYETLNLCFNLPHTVIKVNNHPFRLSFDWCSGHSIQPRKNLEELGYLRDELLLRIVLQWKEILFVDVLCLAIN